MKNIKTWEEFKYLDIFKSGKKYNNEFVKLEKEFKIFNKDIDLKNDKIFKKFLKYFKDAIHIFNKMKKKNHNYNELETVYKFIYENSIIDNIIINNLYIDEINDIYNFINIWNDKFQRYYSKRKLK